MRLKKLKFRPYFSPKAGWAHTFSIAEIARNQLIRVKKAFGFHSLMQEHQAAQKITARLMAGTRSHLFCHS